MKNRNIVVITVAFALAFALAPVTRAMPTPQGGPTVDPAPAATDPANAPAATAAPPTNSSGATSSNAIEFPVVTIHSAGNILRGKIGSFVLNMKPALMFGGTHVNFKVSGTAVPGVDYVALISPAYIAHSGYGVISLRTLADPRGSFNHQAYSVVVTLEPGAGYAVGKPNSALIWISTSCVLEACW